jgi:TRAP-type C4-dicarboxylate transport system permease small subunit
MQLIYLGGAVLAAICLVLIALLTLTQVIGRAIGVMIVDAGEIAGYAMAASIFLALAYTLREGGHIRVSLLLSHVSPRFRRALEIWCLMSFSGLAIFFAYTCISFVIDSHTFGDVSTGMVVIPLWIPQTPMALGTVLLAMALVQETIRVLRGHQPIYETKESQGFSSDKG